MKTKMHTNWVTTVFALLVVAVHWLGNVEGIHLALFTYKAAAVIFFIIFGMVLNFAYNDSAIMNLLSTFINGKNKSKAIDNLNKQHFLDLSTFIHICCGIYFFMRVEDVMLHMSFLFFIYYLRVTQLILSSITVRHLHYLDAVDEAKNKSEDDHLGYM